MLTSKVNQIHAHDFHWTCCSNLSLWRSCRRSRVPGLILVGTMTLLPFIMSPSRAVNSSWKHQYGCRCSGRSRMLIWPTSDDEICKFSQSGVGFRLLLQGIEWCWFHLQDLCNADVETRDLSGTAWFNKMRVSARSTLLDPTYTTWMSYLERRSSILYNLAGARLIGF